MKIYNFLTKLNNTLGPVIQDTTWVKAQHQAYQIDENLKIIGYTTKVEVPGKYYRDDKLKPTETIYGQNI